MTAILDIDTTMLAAADKSATEAATIAGNDYLDTHFGGKDGGCCGFAWVAYWPKNKGNTKLGKQERRMMESIGFSKSYNNSWEKWGPGRVPCQNIDAKYAAAKAYAKVLAALTGVTVNPQNRVD